MPNCKLTAQSLSEWFATPQGGYVLTREQAYFDHTVSDIFGYNALQLGLPEHNFLRSNRMPLRFTGAGQPDASVRARYGEAKPSGETTSHLTRPPENAGQVAGYGTGVPASHLLTQSAGSASNVPEVRLCCDELPFACDSLDLVLLPHILEFAEHPHQILREVERVLRPEGNLIVSGFNPRSLWGMRRALSRKRGYPWSGHFITLPRLKDWLALLGFEVVGGRFAAYAPPFQQTRWLERYAFMETAGDRWWAVSGGVYFLHAVKRVPGMRLIKPQWNNGLVKRLLPVAPKLNNKITQRSETDPQ